MKEIKHQDHLDNMARQGTPARHTPGPWRYQEGADAYTHIVRVGENRFICQLAQDRSGEAEANTRLIASAPDMLAELEWLYQKHGYASTRDVLTKAKGIV